MARSPEAVPTEVPLAEAGAILDELVDAAAAGKVIYLTRGGRRIAAIVPAGETMGINPAALAIARDFITKHRGLFDRLADA